jgi:hypothetical protein
MPKEYKITNEILTMLESDDKELQTLAITLMGYQFRTFHDFNHFRDFLSKYGFFVTYVPRPTTSDNFEITAGQLSIRKYEYPTSRNLWKPTGE